MINSCIKKRALVTGATGYIGSNLVRHLLTLGWEVHIVIRTNSSLALLEAELISITVHHHDGSSGGIKGVLSRARPDTVFHLASLFLAQHNSDDIEALIHSNLLFSTQLVEAMVSTGAKSLINTGTAWQHYNNKAYSPVNLYAATKQAFEDILAYYVEAHGLKASTLILFDTYGPNDPRSKLIPLLWKTVATQQHLYMSPGEQLIDLVYIDDVVRAFSISADALRSQEMGYMRYGVASGSPIRLIDLVMMFQRINNIQLPIEFGGRPYRDREVMRTWDRYNSLPGWKPRMSLLEGLLNSKPQG